MHFPRVGPNGEIAYGGCIGSVKRLYWRSGSPLVGAVAVAVSPAGGSAYVASFGTSSVSHVFAGGPHGEIAWDGCWANSAASLCGALPGTALAGATGVAVSPDGRSVYVASVNGDSISHFFSNGPQGQISWDGCHGNDATRGCGDLPNDPLDGASAVAVSPDGKSVYVTARDSDSISHFFSNGPEGQLSWDDCYGNDGSHGCANGPGEPLDGPSAVAVSPDGKSIYAVSYGGDSIAHFVRTGPAGQIEYAGCLANDDSGGCDDLPGAPVNGPQRWR